MVKRKEISSVIIARLDRLTRSTRDAITLIELLNHHGVTLISVAESIDTLSPIGRMVVKIVATFAELERETIGMRTSAALQYLKRLGVKYSKEPPYGWTAHGKKKPLTRNTQEQKILARIKRLHRAGLSYSAIGARLSKAGAKTRAGKPWGKSAVRRRIDPKQRVNYG